jgi:hypothetical protein
LQNNNEYNENDDVGLPALHEEEQKLLFSYDSIQSNFKTQYEKLIKSIVGCFQSFPTLQNKDVEVEVSTFIASIVSSVFATNWLTTLILPITTFLMVFLNQASNWCTNP